MREELRQARLTANLTQKEIAKKLGICERMYQRLEECTSEGKISIWIKLSDMLGVDVREIYTPICKK
jgi:DNA-binding XRE family transcriptional regulator